jgi:putative tricarboxylic transport membrane protein
MDFLQQLPLGLAQLFSLKPLIGLLFGATYGFLFGLVPGLQPITALAVILPFTFSMDPVVAMYVFAGLIGANGRGGCIPAIVLGIPGTAQNAATVFDGYPMSQRGEGSRALGIASGTAMLGATFSLIVLVLFIPVFVPFLLNFGPAELFWVMTFGLVAMSAALPGPFLKALFAVTLGMVLAAIGYGGPAVAVPRFTFGSTFLLDGIDLVVIISGLLVVSQAFIYLFERSGIPSRANASGPGVGMQWREFFAGCWEPLKYPGAVIRSSILGTVVGAVPGVGGKVAQFLSYNLGYATSREREQFGKGSVEGLITAEAAVDAKEGGMLLPTFVFGIPGNGEMAFVLAAWTIYGLQPGPLFLNEHADLAWALILGLFVANLFATALTLGCASFVTRIPNVRPEYIGLTIILVSAVAIMVVRSNVWDVALVLATGLIGYLLMLARISVIGVVIGFVLGDLMESSYYTALQTGFGDYRIFVSSAVSIALATATALIILAVIVRVGWRAVQGAPPAVDRPTSRLA